MSICSCGCGCEIEKKPSHKYYKPKFIYGHNNRGKNNPRYGHKLTQETKNKISDNHTDFSGSNNPNYGKGLFGENNPMYDVHRYGEEAANWKGGSEGYLHKKARDLFFAGHCERCGIDDNECLLRYKYRLSLHCIDKNHKNLIKENWKTLCSSCHCIIHKK